MQTKTNFDDLSELVSWATTPAQSGLKLNGWGALIAYSAQPLNISWDNLRALPSPPETLEYIQAKYQLTPVNTLHHFSTLGRPTLKFHTSVSGLDGTTLLRRVEKSLDFVTAQNVYLSRNILIAIGGSFSGSQHLNIEAEHPTFSYTVQKNVEYEWNYASYTLTPHGSDDDFKLRIYENHYKNNPAERTAVLGSFVPAQPGILKPPLSFVTSTDSSTGQVIAYVALNQSGSIPLNPDPMLIDGKAAIALVDRRVSQAGIPADLAQLPQLLAPHQQFSMLAANTVSPKDHVAAYNPTSFSAPLNDSKSSSFDIHPLSSLVSPQQKFELHVFPKPATITWTLQPGSKGDVIQEDGQWFYVAPEGPTPNPLTSVDVASTVIDGLRYDSVFIIQNLRQSAYLKFSKFDSRIRLQLCVTDRSGKEVIIPADDTEWTILHGNGWIDQQGAFIPHAQAPSPFTVIQALDKSSPLWIWACVMLPVPLLSVDDTISMLNS